MLIELPDFDDDGRSLEETDAFKQDCQRYLTAHPEFADVIHWFRWMLARNAENEYVCQLPEPYNTFYTMSSGDVPFFTPPSVIVIFQFDDSTVTLYGLNVVDDD